MKNTLTDLERKVLKAESNNNFKEANELLSKLYSDISLKDIEKLDKETQLFKLGAFDNAKNS